MQSHIVIFHRQAEKITSEARRQMAQDARFACFKFPNRKAGARIGEGGAKSKARQESHELDLGAHAGFFEDTAHMGADGADGYARGLGDRLWPQSGC